MHSICWDWLIIIIIIIVLWVSAVWLVRLGAMLYDDNDDDNN